MPTFFTNCGVHTDSSKNKPMFCSYSYIIVREVVLERKTSIFNLIEREKKLALPSISNLKSSWEMWNTLSSEDGRQDGKEKYSKFRQLQKRIGCWV